MSIINFIRKTKNLPVEEVPLAIRQFDPSLTTSSPYTIYFDLFKNHQAGLNYRRLVEFMKWINTKLNELPPVSSVEQTMCKIRGLVKQTYSYDSQEYRASRKSIVFDRPTKNKKIKDYEAKIQRENRNSEDLPISLMNKIFEDNKACNTFQQMLTYLLLDSGCRFDEIYNGVFKNARRGFVSLSNISKTLDKQKTIKKELLTQDATTFMKVLKKYRALNKPPESAIIQLNSYLRDKYNFTSYALRKYFANVSYCLLDDPSIQKNAHLANVLGHSTDTIARVYSSFTVLKDVAVNFRKMPQD